jgi:hypothetical protein
MQPIQQMRALKEEEKQASSPSEMRRREIAFLTALFGEDGREDDPDPTTVARAEAPTNVARTETRTIEGPDRRVRSMKAVAKRIMDMGIDVTWTSMHRYCVEAAAKYPSAFEEKLEAFGLRREQAHRIMITYVPSVLRGKIMSELRRWHAPSGRAFLSSGHYFSKISDRKKPDDYLRVRDALEDLCAEIEQANDNCENCEYLRFVYDAAIGALRIAPERDVVPLNWVRAIGAAHHAAMEAAPKVAFLMVSRMTSFAYGTRSEEDSREREEDALRSLLAAIRVGGSVAGVCQVVFDKTNLQYGSGKIDQKDMVLTSVRSFTDAIHDWCRQAFSDTISHVRLMDISFCEYFRQNFGHDIWSKRFDLARAYSVD